MGSFLAVANGSAEPPAVIVVRHTPTAPAARKAGGLVATGGLGCDGEIALGLIGLQSVFHGGPML